MGRLASELVFVLGIDPGLSRCGYGVVERLGLDTSPEDLAENT